MTEVNGLYLTFFWWTLGFLAVSWVVIAGSLVALRLRDNGQDMGRRRSTFDVAWTVAPALIVLLVAVPVVAGAIAEEGNTEQGVQGVASEQVTVVEQKEISVEADVAISEPETPFVPGCCESGRLRKTTEEDDLVN